jgi:hypothetical protein
LYTTWQLFVQQMLERKCSLIRCRGARCSRRLDLAQQIFGTPRRTLADNRIAAQIGLNIMRSRELRGGSKSWDASLGEFNPSQIEDWRDKMREGDTTSLAVQR